MNALRLSRVILTGALVVMLLGGTASGAVVVLPTVHWTVTGIDDSGATQASVPSLDGKLIAYQSNAGTIKVRNIVTGETRTIPDAAEPGGSQWAPDVSGDRVVFHDNSDGDWDIMMYRWSTDSVWMVRDTANDERYARIDGNHVVWYDRTLNELWARSYDIGGYAAQLQTTDAHNTMYDVDNGRLVFIDSDGNILYTKTLRPDSGAPVPLADLGDPGSLQLHGRNVAVGVNPISGGRDVISYNLQNDEISVVAADADVDVYEVDPTVFDETYAWSVAGSEIGANFDIDYARYSPLALTPKFGDATEDDNYPSLYGHRIAYEKHYLDTDWDVMLATADLKLQRRTAGANRYATATAVSAKYFDDASNVVLCSGADFPDALSAAPLARALDAPLLLTAPTTLPSETLAEITRLTPSKIWIIGGETAVSAGIATTLDATYDVERVSGADRYATSAKIATRLEDLVGDAVVDRAFFARGDAFADALAVGPVAAASVAPILLVRTTSVPAPVASAVDQLDLLSGYVIGGTGAVSSATEGTLKTLIAANGGSAPQTERWSGANRYATAAVVADNGLANRWIDLDAIGFAVGSNFPDALGGGAALGYYGSPLLLTASSSLSADTATFLDAHRYEVGRIEVFGGTGVITDATYEAIKARIY